MPRHKRSTEVPQRALPFEIEIAGAFSRPALEELLRIPDSDFKVVPGGREIASDPSRDLELQSRRLAAALLPFADSYPMPFFRLEN